MDKSRLNSHAPSFTSSPATKSYLPNRYITISKVEYDDLLRSAKDHEILKEALYRGGVAPETLNVLIHGNTTRSRRDSGCGVKDSSTTEKRDPTHPVSKDSRFEIPEDTTTVRASCLRPPPGLPVNVKQSRSSTQGYRPKVNHISSSIYDKSSSIDEEDRDAGLDYFRDDASTIEDQGSKTLQITGLSTLTTYKDITSAIRGGAVIAVRINQRDRSASVTMSNGAIGFLAHVRRNDLYIASKRVSVHLALRQFKLSDHIRRQVLSGSTRNLVIRNGATRFTEQEIRDDMAHIDNLIIIAVVIRGQDMYIHTNSVHGALFARTCMLSRRAFKNIRVEHFPDECAEALVVPSTRQRTEVPYAVGKKAAVGNMFKLLDSWSEDGGSDSGSDVVAAQRSEDSDELIDANSDDEDSEGVSLGGF